MKCLILLSIVAGAFAFLDCPANQHYDSCGTACPLTCDNLDDPPNACVLKCVPGCHCDEGYVKNKQGECVKPEQCPEDCLPNQHYDSCGTACPLTCDDLDELVPKPCVKMCVPGCFCDTGYVKNKQGNCVLPERCPSEVRKSGVCDLPKRTSLCMGDIHHRFYFNKESGKCESFIYGGCRGNDNNFGTLEECQETCPDRTEDIVYLKSAAHHLDRPDCDKAPETGVCRARIIRFYYDQEAGMCKKFVYGGCGGNRNNFETEFECYNKCGALAAPTACSQKKEVGLCRGAFPRYFFNEETGKCEYFIYGGCGGNDNNFETASDCEALCMNSQ